MNKVDVTVVGFIGRDGYVNLVNPTVSWINESLSKMELDATGGYLKFSIENFEDVQKIELSIDCNHFEGMAFYEVTSSKFLKNGEIITLYHCSQNLDERIVPFGSENVPIRRLISDKDKIFKIMCDFVYITL